MFEAGFEDDRAQSGRLLREALTWSPAHALVLALTSGGATVAAGLLEREEPRDLPMVRGFGDVALLGEQGERPIVLVDDGDQAPETLGAAAWALRSLGTGPLTVAVPVASRYLEAVLPPGSFVVAIRRYTPVKEQPWTAPRAALGERRRPRPDRAGRPWDPAEEERLGALVNEGKPAREIAETLGRTRGAVESRIARIAILRGFQPPAAEALSAMPDLT